MKHLLIVGAGPGIGHGAARAFLGAGYRLSLLARDGERLAALGRSLGIGADRMSSFAVDAGDFPALARCIDEAQKKAGPVDVLLVNAVAFSRGAPSEVEPERLIQDLRVNIGSSIAATRAVLPGMRNRRAGTLLFTGGGWALYPEPAFAAMGVGKGAQRTWTLLLAEELKDSGIRVCTMTILGSVAPGTDFDPGVIGRRFLQLAESREPLPAEYLFRGEHTEP
jgi:NADP-dependent 3-hydroxy acid dehydrogenase YdfG